MRFLFIALFTCLTTLPIMADTARIMYYDFFGEYLSEDSYKIEMDPTEDSIFQLKEMLMTKRNRSTAIDSDLVLIGYGKREVVGSFFAATKNIDNRMPLSQCMTNPQQQDGAQWFIYFVDKRYSHYVTDMKDDHHWSSPFKALTRIGTQNLTYF